MKRKIKWLFVIIFLIFYAELRVFGQTKIIEPEMILVEGGSFMMGNKDGEDDEKPVHKVTLSNFYIGKYEVTVAQYQQFCTATGAKMPELPSEEWYKEHEQVKKWRWKETHPIVNVTWNDAVAYCKWLSEVTKKSFSLPTEAQWEYACRGGKKTKGYKFCGSNNAAEVAWYDETSYERGTQPVGTLKPNELGIYDMSGNAWEWCYDKYGTYENTAQTNPQGAKAGKFRVIRGGGWYYVEDMSRITARDGPYPYYNNFNYGFRIVMNP